MKKRLLSATLVLCMALNLLPREAFAVDTTELVEPQVTKLMVSFDNGEPVELLGEQPTVTMPAGSKPVFMVTFDDTELLNQVFVTSTKDGETKYLEATLQGDQYVTDGYFDSSNANYIPGTIAVTYSKKAVKVDESGNVGGTNLDTLKTQLTAQGVFSRNEATNDDGIVTAEIVLGNTFGSMADVYFDAAVSEFTAGAGIDQGELDKWLGVYQNLSKLSSYDLESADGKQFTLYLGDGKDFGDSDTYLVMVKDATSNKYTKTILQKAANKAGLGDISDSLAAANVATKKLLEYSAISKETSSLREEIEAHPTMTAQEKAEASAKIDALDRDKKLFLIGMTAISLLTAPAGAPLMISALAAGYSSMADYFWEHRVGLIKGCEPIDNAFSDESSHGTPITKEYLKENNYCILASGMYYLAEDISLIIIPEQLDVTLCLHGHNIEYDVSNSSGSSLTLHDCKYVEGSDGVTSGGIIGVTLGGDYYTVANRSDGTLKIRNCIVNGPLYNYGNAAIASGTFSVIRNEGEMSITGGIFTNSSYNQGTMDIVGGTFINCMGNGHGGTLNISAGTWIASASSCVSNSGTLNITGGTFSSSGTSECISNTVDISNAGIAGYPDAEVNIGKCTIETTGLCPAIYNNGKMELNGTSITTEGTSISNNGELIIKSGSITSKATAGTGNPLRISVIDNQSNGKLSILGGTVQAVGSNFDNTYGIQNKNKGTLTTSGGTIIGGTSISNHGTAKIGGNTVLSGHSTDEKTDFSVGIYNFEKLEISGCKIQNHSIGARNAYSSCEMKLVIGNDSSIEVDALTYAFDVDDIDTTGGPIKTLEIVAAEGYTGNVTCYGSKTSTGTTMAVEDVVSKYTPYMVPEYVRLVAGGAVSGDDDNITVAPSAGGNVSCSTSMAQEGDTVTITVTPDVGYEGGAPTVTDADGNTITVTDKGNGTYSFVMPAGNVTIAAAAFTPISYKVTVAEKISNGTVTVSPTTATAGTEVTITATPVNKAYVLETITVVDVDGGTVAVTGTTFIMPTKAVTVNATFKLKDTPVLTYTSYEKMTAADKKLYYGGKLEISGLTSSEQYVVTFDNGLVTNGVIPRLVTVATADATGKITLSCQSSVNVMVFRVIGEDVNTDLVELYAKKHAGVPVTSLVNSST